MCCLTNASLIIFCVIIFVAMVLTIVAFVTPGWSSVYMTSSNQTQVNDSTLSKYTTQLGLINRLCPTSSDPTQQTDASVSQRCEAAFDHMETWEQTTLACMVLTIMLQLASLIYSAILICACSCCPCKSTLTLPIIAFAAVGFLLELIAVCVYAGKQNSQDVYGSLSSMSASYSSLQQQSSMGYSLWLAIGSVVLMLAGTVMAYITHKVTKVSIIG